MDTFNSIRELVRKGDVEATEKAIHELQKAFIFKEFDPAPAYLLESRLNSNEESNHLGILEQGKYDLEKHKIINSILKLTTQIEKGIDLISIKPLPVNVIRKNIGKNKIEIDFKAFNEIHFLEIKTKWLHFVVFHNNNNKPI